MGALGYLLTATLFQTAAIANCNLVLVTIGIFFIVAMPASSFLFYMRLRAIFYHNRIVQVIFAVLWLSVLGAAATVPFALKGQHIGPTQYCVNSEVQSYVSASAIASAINDTLVLLAISYKLFKNNDTYSTWREIDLSVFRGTGLNMISKTLYQGGLIYYTSTVIMNVIAMTIVLTPSAPPIYRAMVAPPNIAIQNVMACRLFRKLKLGIIGNAPESSQQSLQMSWRNGNHGLPPISIGSSGNTSFGPKPRPTFDDSERGHDVVNIKVTNDVHLAMD